jgi:Bacterial DNA-binding protein
MGLSRSESAALVEGVLGEISDCLATGDTVKLTAFGSFLVRDKGLGVWSDTPETSLDQADRFAREAIARDDQDPYAHLVASGGGSWGGILVVASDDI